MKVSGGDQDSGYYFMYDIDNDCVLNKLVISADDDTGEYSFLPAEDEGGILLIKKDENENNLDPVITNGNIKLIDIRLEENRELCERFNKDWYLKETN